MSGFPNGFPIQMQARNGNAIETLVGTLTVNESLKAYLERGAEFSLHPSVRGIDKKELVGLYLQPLAATSFEEYDRGYKDGYAKGLEASEKVAALEEEIARLNQLLNPTSDVSPTSEGDGRRLIKTSGINGRAEYIWPDEKPSFIGNRYKGD